MVTGKDMPSPGTAGEGVVAQAQVIKLPCFRTVCAVRRPLPEHGGVARNKPYERCCVLVEVFPKIFCVDSNSKCKKFVVRVNYGTQTLLWHLHNMGVWVTQYC